MKRKNDVSQKVGYWVLAVVPALLLNGPATRLAYGNEHLDGSTLQLEEVIVTARKREESLQDVPIAISAVSGSEIIERELQQLSDLSESIPNFAVIGNIGIDTLVVRGISSGNNFGFEQAVGQVVDGFFYGRSRLTRLNFLDIERVEILKGPQGALIGKNTTAGVINITTARPKDEFEAWGSAKYVNYTDHGGDGEIIEGAVSGPFSDSFRGRLALRYEDVDGWVQNPAADQDQPASDNWMGRINLEWLPSENWRAAVHWTESEQEVQGASVQLSNCGEALLEVVESLGLPTDENCGDPDNISYSLAPINGQGNFDVSKTDTGLGGVVIDWDLGRHTLTSLTGYAEFHGDDTLEGDRLPIEYGIGNLEEDYKQWSQELRLTSDWGGAFDYIIGFFYQYREQTSRVRQDIVASNCLGCGQFPPTQLSLFSNTDEESETYAIFGQLNWHINDTWTVSIDGRYTDEEKEADKVFYPTELYSDARAEAFPPPFDAIFPPPAVILGSHEVSQKRTEDNFSPGFALQWTPNENMMIYGSLRRGFKGGGFDHLNFERQETVEDGFQFADEGVTAYEVGAKMTLADGTVQINTAIFRMDFVDLQTSTINQKSVPAFARVSNAGEATSQAMELEAKWLPLDNLLLSAAVGYLDAKFDQYPDAVCYFGQTPEQGCDPGPDDLLGTSDDTQDLAGSPLAHSPEWTAVINGEYVWYLSDALKVSMFAQGVYSDEFFSAIDQDPVLLQDNYWKFNAHITLASLDGVWEVSLGARNITNEKTSSIGNDLPAGFLPSGYERFLDPTRSITLRGTFRF